jgi:hypothetical protein
VYTAANLVNECFGFDWDIETLFVDWWKELLEDSRETDRPKEALRAIYDWAVSKENSFRKNSHEFKNPEFLGEWNPANNEWEDIKIVPSKLEDELKRLEYEPKAILKSWMQRGWLETSPGRGYRKQVKRKGAKYDFVVVKREALES